jgi:hypothetical protein
MTGPKKEVVPSIVMHLILLTILVLWAMFTFPTLGKRINGEVPVFGSIVAYVGLAMIVAS